MKWLLVTRLIGRNSSESAANYVEYGLCSRKSPSLTDFTYSNTDWIEKRYRGSFAKMHLS